MPTASGPRPCVRANVTATQPEITPLVICVFVIIAILSSAVETADSITRIASVCNERWKFQLGGVLVLGRAQHSQGYRNKIVETKI